MKIYTIRHGETAWNVLRRLQGATDIPLNEKGIALAKETAKALQDVAFDRVYTSPLSRAKQTAEIILGDRQIPMIEDARLREICFGSYEGRCYAQDDENIRNFFNNPGLYIPKEDGETIEQLCSRTAAFLKEICEDPALQEQTILISTHGAALKSMLNGIKGCEPAHFWEGGVHKNCAVSILECKDGKVEILQENAVYYDSSLVSEFIVKNDGK